MWEEILKYCCHYIVCSPENKLFFDRKRLAHYISRSQLLKTKFKCVITNLIKIKVPVCPVCLMWVNCPFKQRAFFSLCIALSKHGWLCYQEALWSMLLRTAAAVSWPHHNNTIPGWLSTEKCEDKMAPSQLRGSTWSRWWIPLACLGCFREGELQVKNNLFTRSPTLPWNCA